MNRNPYFVRRIRKIGPKIDLGCGKKTRSGYVGVDAFEHGQDVLWDITEGLPFPDNSVTEIWSSHFVEHINESEITDLFVEMLRICSPGAVIEIHCPHCAEPEAYFHNHLTLWSVLRIKGIVRGFSGSAKIRGQKYLDGKFYELISANKVGMELVAKLRVRRV